MADGFPALEHIAKFFAALLGELGQAERKQNQLILLQGQVSTCRDDTDRELPFHQEANFHYLTGCLVPSSFLAIACVPNPSSTSSVSDVGQWTVTPTLFIPAEDPESSLWSGPPPTLAQAQKMYAIPHITHIGPESRGISSLISSFIEQSPNPPLIHRFDPTSPLYPPFPPSLSSLPPSTSTHLQLALHRARLLKTPHEIALIREACRISSGAHEVVMRELGRYARRRGGVGGEDGRKTERTWREGVREWEIESEGDAEAVFVACCRRAGCGQAYLPIVASGTRASTLHYVCNDVIFPSQPPASGSAPFTPPTGRGCCGHDALQPDELSSSTPFAFLPQLLLIDAGCEVRGGYASDITRTMPVGNGGRFTEVGREVYEVVLKMQKAAEAMVRPGVHWDTLHLRCHEILCDEFIRLGIFKGGREEMMESGLSAAFFPHGLGHSLGLDVHDSLQLLRSEHLSLPATSASYPSLFKYLRIRRPLEASMVLTVEPGCYFSHNLLVAHGVLDKGNPLIDQEVLEKYRDVGGVRIEDVVVVTEGGCENLTTVGREVDWVEGVCSGVL